MVNQGDFTVQIVNAETNEAFKEHFDKDMKVYVEVEPDVEYYIQVSGLNTVDALVHVEVDKVSVGYSSTLQAYNKQPKRIGCRNVKGDIAAFRFRKTLVEKPDDDDETSYHESAPRSWTGTVKAKFYVSHPVTDMDNGYTHPGGGWHKGDVGATLGVTPLNQKKGVYSDEGQSKLQQGVSWGRAKFGNKLQEINLTYCSTVGLINFGLLPQPTFQPVAADDDSTACRVTKRPKTEKVTVDLT